jgi:Lon protease-like protein
MMNNIGSNDNMFGIIMFDPESRQIVRVGTVVEVSSKFTSLCFQCIAGCSCIAPVG